MPPKGNKRMRASPCKDKDICAACSIGLDDTAEVINCDKCGRWLCATCLKLSAEEYDLLDKMTSKIGCQQLCILRKVNATETQANSVAATVDDVIKIVTNAISCLQISLTQQMSTLSEGLSNIEAI